MFRGREKAPVCTLYIQDADGPVTNIPPYIVYLNTIKADKKLIVVIDKAAFNDDHVRVVFIDNP